MTNQQDLHQNVEFNAALTQKGKWQLLYLAQNSLTLAPGQQVVIIIVESCQEILGETFDREYFKET